MFAYLNLEFHTLIVSFVMTVLVSGCVFMYCRTRVSRVEEMAIEQSRIMKNYVTQIEYMRQEAACGGHADNMMRVSAAPAAPAAPDNRMRVSDDDVERNVRLTVMERDGDDGDDGDDCDDGDDGDDTMGDSDDEDSYYGDSSDSESVDDSDSSTILSHDDQTDEYLNNKSIVTPTITPTPIQVDTIDPSTTDTLIMAPPHSNPTVPLKKLTKTQLCERISSHNISQRSPGTLMKLKREELISLLESK